MERILLTTILIIPFLYCNAQITDNSGIVFSNTVYQFGLLKEGSNAECIFSFVNKSMNPVAITNIKTFCGCVELTWTKEPVKPNNSGKIKVKFYANTIGTFSKTINVFTNRNDKSIGLTIKGSVSPVAAGK